MHSQEKKKNPRNTAMMLDMLHIVVGVLVVACTVLAFVNPERNSFFSGEFLACSPAKRGERLEPFSKRRKR